MASSSTRVKPIMTMGKYTNYLDLHTTAEQLKILDGLSEDNKKRIGIWLNTVEVKTDSDGSYIENPLSQDPLYIKLYKGNILPRLI
jgi:hypothetical protein